MTDNTAQPSNREEARILAEGIVDTIPQPLLVLNGDLTVRSANRAFYDGFGVEPADTEGRRIYELGNGQWDIPRLRELLGEILPKRQTVEDFEVEHEFERIGRRAMLVSARTLSREGDRPSLVLVAIEDVTGRRRSEWLLQHEKELAEKIIDTVREPLLILHQDLRVQSANRAFYDAFRVEPADTEGRMVYELGNGQWDIPELRRLLAEILPNNEFFDGFEVEHEFERIGRRAMLLNARRINHLQLILLAIEDVTERRRAETKLSAAHQRMTEILESIGDAFYAVDHDWRLTYVNRRTEELWGRPRAELLGRRLWDVFPQVDDVEATESYRLHTQAARERRPVHEEFVSAMFGAWVGVSIYPHAEGLSVYFRDITERKRTEEERELLLAELNHRVKNLFALVQALATHGDGDRPAREYQEVFLGRLRALARTHELLFEARWRGADLRAIAERTLEAYVIDRPGAAEVDGEPVELDPRRGLSVSLILHELATNAAKYGALSRPEGRVRLTWRPLEAEGGPRLRLRWEERGGPPVTPPRERGFGTRLIERAFSFELGGEAELAFRPEGLHLDATFPLS